jgi:hypothetical protein
VGRERVPRRDRAELLRQRYLVLANWAPIETIVGQVTALSLSEWDLATYALHNFHEETNDPIEKRAVAASNRRRLFTFWRELEQRTAFEEREQLLLKARAVTKKNGMTLTLVLLDSGDWPQW